MKTFKRIIKTVLSLLLLTVIGVSGYHLWRMCEVYSQESQVKNDVIMYRPQLHEAGYRPRSAVYGEADTDGGAPAETGRDSINDKSSGANSSTGTGIQGIDTTGTGSNGTSGGLANDNNAGGDGVRRQQDGVSSQQDGVSSQQDGVRRQQDGVSSDGSPSSASDRQTEGESGGPKAGSANAKTQNQGDNETGATVGRQAFEDDAESGECENGSIADMQKEVNDDVVGWITIPNTHIDYPVVIADDNLYYVGRDVRKNKASAGSIFLDCRCTAISSARNTIIYGHNMKNRSMFGDIREFADDYFFENNPNGLLFMKNDTYSLEIFAYLVTGSDDEIIYNTSASRDDLLRHAAEKALNYREPQAGRNIVTLSTCAYDFDGARMVVLASLIPLEPIQNSDG